MQISRTEAIDIWIRAVNKYVRVSAADTAVSTASRRGPNLAFHHAQDHIVHEGLSTLAQNLSSAFKV